MDFDHEAASRLSEQPELPGLVARQPLDGRRQKAKASLPLLAAIGFPQAGEHVIADADRRPFVSPRDLTRIRGGAPSSSSFQ